MIENVDVIFGNSLEIRILTTIIPLGAGSKVNTKQVMTATGASEKQVLRCLNKFRASGFLTVSTSQVSESQPPSEWHFWQIKDSNRLRALQHLITCAYVDELTAKSKVLLGEP